MEQAETIVSHRSAVLPISACARLRQGASARATFILEEAADGTTITVGADEHCDWQVRAAFVPANAFSLRLRDGQVQVLPGAAQSVLLNGKLLGEGWATVPNGARIDVGLARVEVAVGIGVAHYDAHRVRRVGFAVGPEPTSVPASHHSLLDALPLEGVRAPIALPPDAARPGAREPIASGQITARLVEARGPFAGEPSLAADPEHVPPAVLLRDLPEESGEFEVYRRHRASNPALLERAEVGDTGALRRYALVGVVTACAYGGWLALLDFL